MFFFWNDTPVWVFIVPHATTCKKERKLADKVLVYRLSKKVWFHAFQFMFVYLLTSWMTMVCRAHQSFLVFARRMTPFSCLHKERIVAFEKKIWNAWYEAWLKEGLVSSTSDKDITLNTITLNDRRYNITLVVYCHYERGNFFYKSLQQ